MTTKFREFIKPGTNFEFVGKARLWFTISVIAVLASIAMLPINRMVRGSVLNWTIDFKGGTEVTLAFNPPVKPGQVRGALEAAGHKGVDVSQFDFEEGGQKRNGYLIRLPEFGMVGKEQGDKVADAFMAKFGERGISRATWSGDTFFVDADNAVTQEEFAAFLKEHGLEPKPWTAEQDSAVAGGAKGAVQHNYQVAVYGLDLKVQQELAKALGVQVEVKQVDAVGAKAGKDLRNDGIKSLLYAIALIMLYIAFRFDFRYGPGAAAALIHDAIIVVGVFAVTWTEFSLVTVAAILTVIGYSINDTIVVFDRIRENEHRLKDKKLDRVINISINETLSRTILASLTTFVTTLAMNLLGTGLVKNFAFAMNVGIIVGTYSSIFIASPIMLWLNEHYFAKRPVTRRRVPVEAESA